MSINNGTINTPKNTIIEHEYVDLGLSVMWATCNVGASSPSDIGSYFAWGEIKTKTAYNLYNCTTREDKIGEIAGNPQYDVASALWGGTWRLPTKEEMEELIKRCRWEWMSQDSYNGYKVTAQNGNSIFLPTTGFIYGNLHEYVTVMGKYLSATALSHFPKIAYDMVFLYQGEKNLLLESRGIGCCVRPVSSTLMESNTTPKNMKESSKDANQFVGQINEHDYVDLGLSVNWATCNVGANTSSNYGAHFAWGETTPISGCSNKNSDTMGKDIGGIAGNDKYDAATAIWGNPWRMPTKEEVDELIIECNWEWVSQDGRNGFKITGPTGRNIFLPAAGLCYEQQPQHVGEYGEYWSASPHPDFTETAYSLVSYYAKKNIVIVQHDRRDAGRCIRPVADRV